MDSPNRPPSVSSSALEIFKMSTVVLFRGLLSLISFRSDITLSLKTLSSARLILSLLKFPARQRALYHYTERDCTRTARAMRGRKLSNLFGLNKAVYSFY